jgi:hypothetical protein
VGWIKADWVRRSGLPGPSVWTRARLQRRRRAGPKWWLCAQSTTRDASSYLFLKSHLQGVLMFGAFECFVLKAHPDLPYAKFFKNIAHTTCPGPRVGFQVSPQVVMDSYILHLRGTNIGDKLPGRFNKYNAMVTRVGMISGTFMEFWIEGGLVKSSKAITLLNYYKEEDKVIHAKVLELGSDLPVLCRTVFQLLELFRNNEKHVASGARVLSTIGVVGWTSCMTKYTPKYKDGSLPKDDED